MAFASIAGNLVTGDENGATDVFVHNRDTATTTRVSVSSQGDEGDGGSNYPSISAAGRYVAFQSTATDLVPGDTNSGDRRVRPRSRVRPYPEGLRLLDQGRRQQQE